MFIKKKLPTKIVENDIFLIDTWKKRKNPIFFVFFPKKSPNIRKEVSRKATDKNYKYQMT